MGKIARASLFLLGLAALYGWARIVPGLNRLVPGMPGLGRAFAFLPSLTSIAAAIACYAAAKSQGRSRGNWAAFALFIPYLAAMILAFLPDTRWVPKAQAAGGTDTEVPQPRGDGDTPLHMAAFQGDLGRVKLLVGQGADVNAKILGGGDPGATPLHLAAMKGHADVVAALVASGADVNAKLDGGGQTSTSGATPLHLAATHDMTSAIRALIDGGADIEAEDDNGDTALHYAANRGLADMVRALVRAGANVNAVDDYGRTPSSLAKGRKSVEILLREPEAKGEGDKKGVGSGCSRCSKPVLSKRQFIDELARQGIVVDPDNVDLYKASGVGMGIEAYQSAVSSTQAKYEEVQKSRAFKCQSCGGIFCMECLLRCAPSHSNGGKACPSCGGVFAEF